MQSEQNKELPTARWRVNSKQIQNPSEMKLVNNLDQFKGIMDMHIIKTKQTAKDLYLKNTTSVESRPTNLQLEHN